MVCRLRAVLTDADAPTSLRSLVLELFWPHVISTAELLAAVQPAHRFAFQDLRLRAINTFRQAIGDGQVPARELVDWFRADSRALHEQSTADVAAQVALDAIGSAVRPSERWDAAGDLVDTLLTATGDRIPWSADDLSTLSAERRRNLARD